MLRLILLATLTVATVFATGDFVVLHSPKSVVFTGKEVIDHSILQDVFKAILGFTITPVKAWSGLRVDSPFKLPEALVVVAVEGARGLESPNGKIFPLGDVESEEIGWQGLNTMFVKRGNQNRLVRISMADGLEKLGQSALGTLEPKSINETSLRYLKVTRDEDKKILEEIKILRAVAKNVPSVVTADGKTDVYWLVVSGVKSLIKRHGKDSDVVKEALFLINEAIDDVTKAFMACYKNEVVITAFTNDASKPRVTRSINLSRWRREETNGDDSDKNIKAENTSSTSIIDGIKNDDEEEIEKIGAEEATRMRTNEEASSLKKSEESSSSITENYEETNETNENKVTEAYETRESSTLKSGLELEDTTRKNEKSNIDTENTNRSFKTDKLNLAKRYSDSYPVIFNIFLWFGLVFFFSLLAICITIADMDPGRDSIIYRMTSTRMKKDN